MEVSPSKPTALFPAGFCLQLSSQLHESYNSSRGWGSRSLQLRTARSRPWRPATNAAWSNSVACSLAMAMANSSNPNRLAGRLFGPGDEGDNWWDDKCVFHPVVVKDPSSSTWRMYYYGRNGDAWSSGVTPALLSTGRIGLALSKDGVHWNRHRGPLPQGAILDPDEEEPTCFDSVHVGCSDVMFHDGQWWMFYFGGSAEKMELRPGARAVQGFRMLPGLVKSEDGVVFDRGPFRGINPLLDVGGLGEWDEVFVAWPRVLPPSETNSAWVLTYSSIEKQTPPFSSIGLATSRDGHRWTKAGKVLARGAPGSWDEGGVGRRHVVVIENEFVMFYEGVDGKGVHGIGVATSSDGARWEKDAGGAVFTARVGEAAWDNGTVAAPHVVHMDDGSFRLYYVGSNDSKSASAIGMAVSQGRNFRSWVRF